MNYIDIRYVISGEECVACMPVQCAQLRLAYPGEDLYYYAGSEAAKKFALLKGEFAIFSPHDVHGPNMQLHGETAVRKAVVKVRCESCE